jgi:hypothetical protein
MVPFSIGWLVATEEDKKFNKSASRFRTDSLHGRAFVFFACFYITILTRSGSYFKSELRTLFVLLLIMFFFILIIGKAERYVANLYTLGFCEQCGGAPVRSQVLHIFFGSCQNEHFFCL